MNRVVEKPVMPNRFLVALASLLVTIVSQNTFAEEAVTVKEKPALIVMIAVDQLRRDRLDNTLPGGLGKILSGRNFVEGQLDHGITNTCPGHVVMLTGMNPGKAGIPGNMFVDRETYEHRYCVDDLDDSTQVIGGSLNRSPRNIRASALGDWLKSEDSNSRVYSVSGKDRAAITLGGQNPDGVYWYHKDTGRFTSSGYYTDELPDYIKQFNGTTPELDGYIATLPERWEHDVKTARADDYEGEREDFMRVSGHPVRSGDETYEQIYRSPYLDELTFEVAKRVANEEKLGQGEATDLLIVSFSATDTLGHSYGPRSAEAADALLKLDHWLGELLTMLEAQVGEGKVLVALSADHGVAELPEYTTEKQVNSCPEQGRLSVNQFIASLYWNIYKEFSFPFGRPDHLVVFGGSSFTVDESEAQSLEVEKADIINWLDDYLTGIEVVEKTWTRQELADGTDDIARLLRNSFVPDKSGDVFLQLKEDCVMFPDAGTTHGSVYDYDRDIPVVFYGWQVEPGEVSGAAYSVDIAPSLADHIGIKVPMGLDGKVLPLSAQ